MINVLINININLFEILVVVSSLLLLVKIKKKGDTAKPKFKVDHINLKTTLKLLNFNINSKNRNNIKK